MNKELLDLSVYAIKKASKVIVKYYNSDLGIKMKGIGNPVTDADYEADDVLHEELIKETPNFGWLSEETKDSPDRLEKEFVWIVDPLDGTKEFVDGKNSKLYFVYLPEYARYKTKFDNTECTRSCWCLCRF